MNKVFIGCPVRNRAWVLPVYLDHIKNLDYPKELVEYCFIINDCTDNTSEILQDFAKNQKNKVKLVTKNLGSEDRHERGWYSFTRLTRLRNYLLEEFLKSDCNYFFSVDSDILVPPNALSQLINNDCEIVSALVCNGHEVGNTNIYNILKKVDGNSWHFITDFSREGLFSVDCTGAAYLIKRNVIEKHNVRYSSLYGAEDIGFCEDVKRKGIPIYCDGRIECRHIMNKIYL
ncbi:Glycosyltransferases involved in cell wall biogenesis [Candidatus Syntrophocurvum alkaliphilum]|uniref:Glycosyltransferases involved in cell wall biogenesis n=1 Tax=Candidatus Syntrophocurvum alkaliphilum TaxID=2293317 RepID=A0A6I6DD62_9FIRM|nr:glycosyltransferase family 2 protein [Candidatus Syntrophocurvum alkaliphilum]QGU00565.1 Glycosyltransferases involved in cell wall biogenesis [Candidatus Syntrophocurvum alkaliphilum]